MLKKVFQLLDFFLPSSLGDDLDIALLFRARSIIAAGLLGIMIVVPLFIGATILETSLAVRIGIISSFLALISLIIFLKTRNKNFESSLNFGAFIQLLIIYISVYANSFSTRGMGFFGLIWLIPLFLMTSFYFKPFFGSLLFVFNTIVLIIVFVIFHDTFNHPMERIPNFKAVFMLFLFLTLMASYLLSQLFAHLNGSLKEELSKQKNLLLESAKFQSLGQMASNLAHDINNPLFTIQGKLHQIRNLLSQDQLDLEKCDGIIEDVEGTILKLSQIVKGISTFARQGHGDQMISISADELIKGIALLGTDRIVQSGITFELKIAPDTRIICYPSHISQVLINLINNAVDALEQAEVKLILVEAFTNDKWIEIHIKDSGPGVPPELETKIFETFFTTKKIGKGTGLGLSISKGLVESHEGQLKYVRTGNMTNFIVRLPSYE